MRETRNRGWHFGPFSGTFRLPDMSLRFAARPLPFLMVAATLFIGAGACQQQGEGAPCDTNNNGSNDCQGGLTCKSVPGVVGDRCCPSTGTSNSADCNGTQTLTDANPPPADVSTVVDSGADATMPEASADAPPEGASSGDAEAGIPADSGNVDSPAD